jgi:hypothetical protein
MAARSDTTARSGNQLFLDGIDGTSRRLSAEYASFARRVENLPRFRRQPPDWHQEATSDTR